MKLTSTNVTLTANEGMGVATISENGKQPAFIQEVFLEELRDLITDYLEMREKEIEI